MGGGSSSSEEDGGVLLQDENYGNGVVGIRWDGDGT